MENDNTKEVLIGSFQSLEALVLDTLNLEPAYVRNLAEIKENGNDLVINFDTRKAKFGHMEDGVDTVNKMQELLSAVGIASTKIEDAEYKRLKEKEPMRVWDEKPALEIRLPITSDSVSKIEQIKENYAIELADEAISHVRHMLQEECYGFSKETQLKIILQAASKPMQS